MRTNNKIESTDRSSLFLWGGAVIAVLLLLGILGWRWFYGFVIPHATLAVALPLTGVIGFSFLAGMLSFFAPCPFAVFPAYAAFFLTSRGDGPSPKTHALRFATTASTGIMSFYVILGIVLATLGIKLAFYTNYLKLGVIALIFFFGLVLLTGRKLPTGFLDPWVNSLSGRFKNWGAFGYGVIYAIAGAACFLPVILTISLIPILSGKFFSGFAAFISYGIAVSVMLTAATFLLAAGKQKLLQALAGKAGAIKKLSGAILLATALFLVAFYVQTGM